MHPKSTGSVHRFLYFKWQLIGYTPCSHPHGWMQNQVRELLFPDDLQKCLSAAGGSFRKYQPDVEHISVTYIDLQPSIFNTLQAIRVSESTRSNTKTRVSGGTDGGSHGCKISDCCCLFPWLHPASAKYPTVSLKPPVLQHNHYFFRNKNTLSIISSDLFKQPLSKVVPTCPVLLSFELSHLISTVRH